MPELGRIQLQSILPACVHYQINGKHLTNFNWEPVAGMCVCPLGMASLPNNSQSGQRAFSLAPKRIPSLSVSFAPQADDELIVYLYSCQVLMRRWDLTKWCALSIWWQNGNDRRMQQLFAVNRLSLSCRNHSQLVVVVRRGSGHDACCTLVLAKGRLNGTGSNWKYLKHLMYLKSALSANRFKVSTFTLKRWVWNLLKN